MRMPFTFLIEIENKYPEFCIKTEKPQIAETILTQEKQRWRHHTSWFQIILQSCRNEKSMALAQKETYNLMPQNRKSGKKSKFPLTTKEDMDCEQGLWEVWRGTGMNFGGDLDRNMHTSYDRCCTWDPCALTGIFRHTLGDKAGMTGHAAMGTLIPMPWWAQCIHTVNLGWAAQPKECSHLSGYIFQESPSMLPSPLWCFLHWRVLLEPWFLCYIQVTHLSLGCSYYLGWWKSSKNG